MPGTPHSIQNTIGPEHSKKALWTRFWRTFFGKDNLAPLDDFFKTASLYAGLFSLSFIGIRTTLSAPKIDPAIFTGCGLGCIICPIMIFAAFIRLGSTYTKFWATLPDQQMREFKVGVGIALAFLLFVWLWACGAGIAAFQIFLAKLAHPS